MEYEKEMRLKKLLNDIGAMSDCKTLIFVETKKKCNDLNYRMKKDGYPVSCIHGDKGQQDRDYALSQVSLCSCSIRTYT